QENLFLAGDGAVTGFELVNTDKGSLRILFGQADGDDAAHRADFQIIALGKIYVLGEQRVFLRPHVVKTGKAGHRETLRNAWPQCTQGLIPQWITFLFLWLFWVDKRRGSHKFVVK